MKSAYPQFVRNSWHNYSIPFCLLCICNNFSSTSFDNAFDASMFSFCASISSCLMIFMCFGAQTPILTLSLLKFRIFFVNYKHHTLSAYHFTIIRSLFYWRPDFHCVISFLSLIFTLIFFLFSQKLYPQILKAAKIQFFLIQNDGFGNFFGKFLVEGLGFLNILVLYDVFYNNKRRK